jgi:hypothetical protein
VLVASTTVTGLQKLIDYANEYVTNHGLSFNPAKTTCLIHGKNPFTIQPEWYIDGEKLQISDHINYLGVILGDNKGSSHCETRIRKCRKSFYALQGAGLCDNGLDVETSVHVWKAACQSVLSYGCEALYMSNQNKEKLNKLQSKLVKCIVGIGPFYKTTPLLQAVGMHKMSSITDYNALVLYSKIMNCNSATKRFNQIMLQQKPICNTLLYNRVKTICKDHSTDILKLIVNTDSIFNMKKLLLPKVKSNENGVVDSLRTIFKHYDNEHKSLAKLLLKAF